MNNRLILAMTTVIAIAAAVFGTLSWISGSFFSSVTLMSMIGAFGLSLLFHLRKHWVALLLVGNLWNIRSGLPLLDTLTYGVILQLVIVCLAWAERIILKKQTIWVLNVGDRAMLLFGVILLIQLIVEHPGSARLGGPGGLGQMIYYVIAGWIYIGGLALAQDEWTEKSAVRWYICASLVFECMGIITRGLEGNYNAFFNVFWIVGFPLFAGMVAWIMQRWKTGKTTIFSVLAIVLFILGISFYAQFRTCPYIALIMIFGIALIYRLRFRFWVIMTALMVGGMLLLQVLPVYSIPQTMRRTLSTFRPFDRASMRQDDAYLGEFGWDSEFRIDLWNRAKLEISAHPWRGAGWGFSFEDIFAAVARGGQEGIKSSNALAGGYHNGMFTLAAKSGLPVALLWGFAYVYLLLRFLCRIPKERDSKILAAVLIGTLAGETVVFLTNGGGPECVHMAIFLAIMSALSKRWDATQKAAVEVVAPAPAPAGMPIARPRYTYVLR
jgi:hypothetical protein